MRQRKRFPDKYKIGRSSTVPYIANESWNDRHLRRKAEALKRSNEVDKWCRNHQWSFSIRNNGHHWLFTTKGKRSIEWFPSSGKLIIGKKWEQGLHVHDIDQLKSVLEICREEEAREPEART